MVKILHTSDLHFKKDDLIYCQDIWREILAIGNSKKVDAVLISGDVFDSFPELESCRESFLEIAMQSKLSIYAIAGNHEYLSMGKQSLDTYDLTKIVWLYKPGYQKIEINPKIGNFLFSLTTKIMRTIEIGKYQLKKNLEY
jgi:DNA repair exonuclease SbcCD nuclease subunit